MVHLAGLATCVAGLGGCAVASRSPAATAAPDVRAREAIEGVFDAFNRCDIEALVAHYSDDNLVFFTGSTGRPVTHRAGLRTYFSYLGEHPCNSPQAVKHTEIKVHPRPLGTTAAVVHANTVVTFVDDKAVANSFPFYFTFVLQETAGRWLVISQNAQRVPKE
jgi:ketosteroid isomerase-like protein